MKLPESDVMSENSLHCDSNVELINNNAPDVLPLKMVYTHDDIKDIEHVYSLPGQPPYVRGPNATMYSVKPWTIRQYAGFSTCQESNMFYRKAMAGGVQGISVAFDLATHRGYDSDHPRVTGDVGKAGVAIDSVEDMKILFDQIPLDSISVSMTMNGAVLPVLAAYIVAAEEQGVASEQLKGTIQNDILKEFMVRNTYIYPPVPSMRIVSDIISYTSKTMPKFNSISISGYHMKEAGASDILELALTLANGKEYVQTALNQGLNVDDFAGRLSFFFGIGMDFYQGIAKLRAARLLWYQTMLAFNPQRATSLILRTHCQTSGWSLTVQDPYNNMVRTTVEAMAAVFGGTQSLHTNAFDEAIALPTDTSARLARNIQLILQEETGICAVVDPWAGSYMMEKITDEMAAGARKLLEEIAAMGGMLKALESGWVMQQISACSVRTQAKIDTGIQVIVGVNKYRLPGERPVDYREVDNSAVRNAQVIRLKTLREVRNAQAVSQVLDNLTHCAKSGVGNLLELSVQAMRVRATVGEVSAVLADVWGRYHTKPQVIQSLYGELLEDNLQWKELLQKVAMFLQQYGRRPKIMIAKLGQDGHDRGAKVVASGFGDLGFEVELGELFMTPEEAADHAMSSGCHAIGVSSLAAGHKTLIPELFNQLSVKNMNNIIVFVGGVIPQQDHEFLYQCGVTDIFEPGTPLLVSARRVFERIENVEQKNNSFVFSKHQLK
ncbi:methylmalonyl-CoA mutase [Serratia proteamaculans]|jgi:methylmalonyl-CoA mutase|uniref:methylmalonyl-CoA mutase n=1 Tax=Serratia proteamaculans TaxID=28151 RepID=UPI000D918CFA|nr:methylmalonyl-CoA mutase [Serratia proteamaculans]CAI0974506.1 Methylmalonyl-CoA mutase [Serratia proteamaculans]CAI1059557.1 Methylmalonyl-CoA mutase [Serratia proteamaculans]SPZ52639.1 Methylmalonyl-CoA mutase [Serratia quinivorans]